MSETNSLYDKQASVSLNINKEKHLAEIVFQGQVTQQLLDETFQALMGHKDFKKNLHACYDYSQAYPGMDMSEIEEHAQLVAKNLSRRGSHYKLALVSDDALNFALLNIYKLLIAKTPVEAQVFQDKDKALGWIARLD